MPRANVSASLGKALPTDQSLVREVRVTRERLDPDSFYRADLVFDGLDHAGASYTARIYFNNPGADAATGPDPAAGYVGSYVVFGHGGCFGAPGHCDLKTRGREPGDLRGKHPLTPMQRRVVVTDALRAVLRDGAEGLSSVSIVPVVEADGDDPEAVEPAPELARFGRLSLKTYR